MKPLLFSCVLFFGTYFFSAAQTNIPAAGDITDYERQMTECPFDKEAVAIVLLDDALSDYDKDYQLITTRRRRIKILKPAGIPLGDIIIPYISDNDFEFINEIAARVYNFDNGDMKVQQVSNKQIFRKKVNQYRSIVSFAMPEIKVGSIIEYSYTSTRKNYVSGLENWYFQEDQPTLISRFTLSILPVAEFSYVVHASSQYPVDIDRKTPGQVRFLMKNIAGLREEPYMDAARDYIQYVEFQLAAYSSQFGGSIKHAANWTEVTNTLIMEPYFGRQLNKSLPGTEEIIHKAKAMPTPMQKMTAIYKYVQDKMNWDGYDGKYTESIKDAWEKKKGDRGEINLILINLLQEAGLDAYPLLVSERSNGKVNPKTAIIDQFNTVMAYVMFDNKFYVLDGASYYTPPFVIPYNVVNTTAFIVDRKKGGIVTLTENTRSEKNSIVVNIKVDESGNMEGATTVYSYDYARIKRERLYKGDKSKFNKYFIYADIKGLTVDSITVDGMDDDSQPMVQKFKFWLPATEAGEYKLLNLNLFTGFEKNPFISDTRFTNIDYGCLQRHTLTEIIQLPPSLQPDNLPKDIKLMMPDKSITVTRLMQYADDKISTRYDIQMARSVYTADEYHSIKEFFKKMVDIMNEQIVLRKKG